MKKSKYYLNNLENGFLLRYQHPVEKHSGKWVQMMKEDIDNLIMVQTCLLFHYYVLR
jgi:hypothetical protein